MYEEYIKEPYAMSFEEADQCFSEIYSAVSKDLDEVMLEIYKDFTNACFRYQKIRVEWSNMSREERINIDAARTSAHNRVIDTHNILARYMDKVGLSTKWYTTIGYDSEDRMTRKKLGDFACYVSLFLGLKYR